MVIMLRSARESPGRFHSSPHAYRVMKSWNGRRELGRVRDRAVHVLVAEHLPAGPHARRSALLISH